jgi:hypothetical protein
VKPGGRDVHAVAWLDSHNIYSAAGVCERSALLHLGHYKILILHPHAKPVGKFPKLRDAGDEWIAGSAGPQAVLVDRVTA